MTYDEVIHTCKICGKEKREPWYPIEGWCRPPKMHLEPPKGGTGESKHCEHDFIYLRQKRMMIDGSTQTKLYDTFYCKKCLKYEYK